MILMLKVEVASLGPHDFAEMHFFTAVASDTPTVGEAKPQEDKELKQNIVKRIVNVAKCRENAWKPRGALSAGLTTAVNTFLTIFSRKLFDLIWGEGDADDDIWPCWTSIVGGDRGSKNLERCWFRSSWWCWWSRLWCWPGWEWWKLEARSRCWCCWQWWWLWRSMMMMMMHTMVLVWKIVRHVLVAASRHRRLTSFSHGVANVMILMLTMVAIDDSLPFETKLPTSQWGWPQSYFDEHDDSLHCLLYKIFFVKQEEAGCKINGNLWGSVEELGGGRGEKLHSSKERLMRKYQLKYLRVKWGDDGRNRVHQTKSWEEGWGLWKCWDATRAMSPPPLAIQMSRCAAIGVKSAPLPTAFATNILVLPFSVPLYNVQCACTHCALRMRIHVWGLRKAMITQKRYFIYVPPLYKKSLPIQALWSRDQLDGSETINISCSSNSQG